MADHDERAKLGCSETYDRENDVYYVTFNTGEPSYCVEVNDVLLIEVGLFSGLPTGFRLLNYTKTENQPIKLTEAIRRTEEIFGRLSDRASERKATLEQALRETVPA